VETVHALSDALDVPLKAFFELYQQALEVVWLIWHGTDYVTVLSLPKKWYIKGDELPAHEPVGSKD
jgi:hypothetical protein